MHPYRSPLQDLPTGWMAKHVRGGWGQGHGASCGCGEGPVSYVCEAHEMLQIRGKMESTGTKIIQKGPLLGAPKPLIECSLTAHQVTGMALLDCLLKQVAGK